MAHPSGIIGDAGVERVRRMAARACGLTIPEIADEFDVSEDTARRYVLRLVRRGILRRTEDRRRRIDIFEKCHGAGGVVYRAVRDDATRDLFRAWINRRGGRQRG